MGFLDLVQDHHAVRPSTREPAIMRDIEHWHQVTVSRASGVDNSSGTFLVTEWLENYQQSRNLTGTCPCLHSECRAFPRIAPHGLC